ncbi:MAG: HEAT repeat domain-containing protein [Planctomycetota bacterium]|nr:HEAT repeat domain-containing protein [Planctomycetota bacterium]
MHRKRHQMMCDMLFCALLIAAPRAAQADIFVLKNEGQVQGTLLNEDEKPRKTYVIQTRTGGQITLDDSQVKNVITQSPAELEYEKIRFSYPDTVEGQWQLAEWCREHNLASKRTVHMERTVELDPEHRQARITLGYNQIEGRWVRRADLMKEQGYQLYKGKWLSPQDVAIQEERGQADLAEKGWVIKLKRLRGQLADRGPRSDAALAEIKSIVDPYAVGAIFEAFKNENSLDVRDLYLDVLSRIPAPRAVEAMAEIALESSNEDTRDRAAELLKNADQTVAGVYLIGALKSRNNYRINRAGIALGTLHVKAAIGPMIDVLKTVHRTKVQQGGGAGSISPGFSGDGGIGFSAGGGRTVIEKNNVNNQGILDSLVKLSDGQNFGFNVNAWRSWHNSQKKAAAPNAGRRD